MKQYICRLLVFTPVFTLLVFGIMASQAYAKPPAVLIFEKVFVRALNTVVGRIRVHRIPLHRLEAAAASEWQAEIQSAIRVALESQKSDFHIAIRDGLEEDVVRLLHRHLRSPTDAIRYVDSNRLSSRLFSEWQSIISRISFVVRRIGPTPSIGRVTHHAHEASLEFSVRNVERFYEAEISELLSSVKPEAIEGVGFQFRQPYHKLKSLFLGDASAKASVLPRYQVWKERGDFLLRLSSQIDDIVSGMNVKGAVNLRAKGTLGSEWQAHVLEGKLRGLQRLENVLMRYGQFLVSQERLIVNVDYYLAQIRFGNFQTQQRAFEMLIHHVAGEGSILSIAQIRSILMHAHFDLRVHVVKILKGRHLISFKAGSAAESIVAATRSLSPGEALHREAMLTLSFLLKALPQSEPLIARVIPSLRGTIAEKIAAIRALGRLGTKRAAQALDGHLATVIELQDEALLMAYVEEMARGYRLEPTVFENAIASLQKMTELGNPAVVQRAGIRGLGLVFEGSNVVKNQEALTLLNLYGNFFREDLQAELFLALSKLELSRRIPVAEGAILATKSKTKELSVSACVYLIRRGIGDEKNNAMVKLFEILEDVSAISEHVFEVGAVARERALSNRVLVNVFELFQEVGIDAVSYSGIMQEFVNVVNPNRVTIEALKVLARTKKPNVAGLLFKTFDNASGSQKREVLKILLFHFDDVPTLRNVVKKIIAFYREPTLQFDLFDAFMTEVSPMARLQLLKGDQATIRALEEVAYGLRQPVELTRFARALLSTLR